MQKTNLIDLHCDTFCRIIEMRYEGKNAGLLKNDFSIDLQKLKKAGYSAQMFACFIPADFIEAQGFKGDAAYDYLKTVSKCMDDEFKLNKADIMLAKNYNEYKHNMNTGKISAFKTIEEGCFLNGNIERLNEVYDMGFRILGLIWKSENCIGFSHSQNPDIMEKGLKPFGIEVVEAANKLGMIIDVSHLSDGGFYDVCKYSKHPFMATHSNCRTLTNKTRNLTDNMIKMLADKGGVMGLNFTPDFLDNSGESKIQYMVSHVSHIKNVGGIETVAIGTDFDGIGSTFDTTQIGSLEIDNAGDMDKLLLALSKAGFTDDEIEKIAYKNVLRVIRDVL